MKIILISAGITLTELKIPVIAIVRSFSFCRSYKIKILVINSVHSFSVIYQVVTSFNTQPGVVTALYKISNTAPGTCLACTSALGTMLTVRT